jgi:hypothetical protein
VRVASRSFILRAVLALTDVDTVALWTGLISAIVSIVLSIVAILFARDVDRRSLEINNQTIRSLEAIQAAVKRLSDDTGGLIKVAWERMLGSVGNTGPRADADLQTLLSGLVGELRQDAGDLPPGKDVDRLIHDMDERVRRATSRHGDRGAMPKSWAFNLVVEAIESVSPLAIELLRALQGGHFLTRAQYQHLRQDPDLAVAMDELRDRDLLMPFQRRGAKGEETVYGIAPWFHAVIGPALVFTDHETPSSPEAERIQTALRDVGYLTDSPVADSVARPH